MYIYVYRDEYVYWMYTYMYIYENLLIYKKFTYMSVYVYTYAYIHIDLCIFFFNRRYRLFSEYSALLHNLEEYCYYEIQIHRRCVNFLLKRVIVG